ncbi:RICIN domain-containing protein [Nonomuraea sp. NPDC050022]|uniref:RICIN domain-containing protein n=1 Tax=unclassified Nonomuraea TaxID=2593643 RepID=UPI0034085806
MRMRKIVTLIAAITLGSGVASSPASAATAVTRQATTSSTAHAATTSRLIDEVYLEADGAPSGHWRLGTANGRTTNNTVLALGQARANNASQRWIMSKTIETDYGDGLVFSLATNPDLCLTRLSTSKGQLLNAYECSGANMPYSNLWRLDFNYGTNNYELVPVGPDGGTLCVDIKGGKFADETRIQLWTCNNTKAQIWKAYSVY